MYCHLPNVAVVFISAILVDPFVLYIHKIIDKGKNPFYTFNSACVTFVICSATDLDLV